MASSSATASSKGGTAEAEAQSKAATTGGKAEATASSSAQAGGGKPADKKPADKKPGESTVAYRRCQIPGCVTAAKRLEMRLRTACRLQPCHL